MSGIRKHISLDEFSRHPVDFFESVVKEKETLTLVNNKGKRIALKALVLSKRPEKPKRRPTTLPLSHEPEDGPTKMWMSLSKTPMKSPPPLKPVSWAMKYLVDMDILITCSAIHHNLTLITHNTNISSKFRISNATHVLSEVKD